MRIELKFENGLSRLAGNIFGEKIFREQVKDYIDYKNKIIIKFPEYIKDVAISFVQGFTNEILKNIDKSEFREYFEIEGNEKVVNKFIKSIYY